MTIEHYALYCMLPTNENIDRLTQYDMAFANRDHCLVIAEEAPEGAMEVGEDDLRLLGTDDWEWIFEMSNRIRQEQEKKYHAQLIEQQKAFFSRFEALLKEQAKEIANAARDE